MPTHHFQAVSSNYGLYGTFKGLDRLFSSGRSRGSLPTPIGVQQAAIAPLVDVFEKGLSPEEAFCRAEYGYRGPGLYEPTLFTTHPATLEENRWLKERFHARFAAISEERFLAGYDRARSLLSERGIELPPSPSDLREKTGVLCMVELLAWVADGRLRKGDHAVVHFTGGVEKLAPFSKADAQVICPPLGTTDEDLAGRIGAILGLP